MTSSASTPAEPLIQDKVAALQATGQRTLHIIQGPFEPEQLVFCLPPSRSHILWLTGHMAYALDRMSAVAVGAPGLLPASYDDLFKIGSQPVADASAYPAFAEVAESFRQVIDAAVARMLTLHDADLARPLPESLPIAHIFPKVGDLLSGFVFHTAYHTGQISLLQRAQGLPSAMGR